MVTISFEKAYLVPYGLLKAIEFITLLIGWAIFVDLTSGVPSFLVHSRVEYFIAIGIISWLFVIVWFVLCVLKVTNEMNLSPKNIWFAAVHLVIGVLQLIGACCVAEYGGYTRIDMGIAFGFIGSFVLIFDGVVHIVLGKNFYGGATVTATVA